MRAWAAPVVDGIRQDHQEVELPCDGFTLKEHRLPWPSVAYRYEFEPGEEVPTMPVKVASSWSEVELPTKGPRWWRWLTGSD